MVDYWNKCNKNDIDVICNVAILCENEYVITTCTCPIKLMTNNDWFIWEKYSKVGFKRCWHSCWITVTTPVSLND